MKRILAVLFVVAAPLSAQNPDLPPMVAEGFQAMVAEGPVAAIDIWAAAWTSDSESINKAQLSNSFADIWETLGGASSFEILTINAIGTRVLEIYAISVHEAQPLYLNLDAYRSESGWRMTGLYAHTSIGEVFPGWVYEGSRTP